MLAIFKVTYSSFSLQNYIKIPFFRLPMIYIVQEFDQQVKDTFSSFI